MTKLFHSYLITMCTSVNAETIQSLMAMIKEMQTQMNEMKEKLVQEHREEIRALEHRLNEQKQINIILNQRLDNQKKETQLSQITYLDISCFNCQV